MANINLSLDVARATGAITETQYQQMRETHAYVSVPINITPIDQSSPSLPEVSIPVTNPIPDPTPEQNITYSPQLQTVTRSVDNAQFPFNYQEVTILENVSYFYGSKLERSRYQTDQQWIDSAKMWIDQMLKDNPQYKPSSPIQSTETHRYALDVGYIGSPSSNAAQIISDKVKPLAMQYGYSVVGVIINNDHVRILLESRGSPIVLLLVMAIVAVVAIAIVGFVISWVSWTNLKTKEVESVEVKDIADVFANVQSDPNLSEETKEVLLTNLSESMGSVTSKDQPTDIYQTLQQTMPMILMIAMVAMLMGVIKR